jgi:hypothetical protein
LTTDVAEVIHSPKTFSDEPMKFFRCRGAKEGDESNDVCGKEDEQG